MIRVVLEYLDHKLKGDLCNLNSLADFIVYWWRMLMTDWQVLTTRALDFYSAASNAASGAWNTSSGSLIGMRTLWWVHKQLFHLSFCNDSIEHLSSLSDSNIWKEFLHLVQGRLLPLDEECYSVNHWLNLRNLLKKKSKTCVQSLHGSVVSLPLL